MERKDCHRCGVNLPVSAFHLHPSGTRLNHECTVCREKQCKRKNSHVDRCIVEGCGRAIRTSRFRTCKKCRVKASQKQREGLPKQNRSYFEPVVRLNHEPDEILHGIMYLRKSFKETFGDNHNV
jgi:hypothetical protein